MTFYVDSDVDLEIGTCERCGRPRRALLVLSGAGLVARPECGRWTCALLSWWRAIWRSL